MRNSKPHGWLCVYVRTSGQKAFVYGTGFRTEQRVERGAGTGLVSAGRSKAQTSAGFREGTAPSVQKNPCMYENDHDWGGFEWLNANDADRSIFSFVRKSKDGKNNLLFVCNFTPVEREDYRVGVPKASTYKLVLNSDDAAFGGSGEKRPASIKAEHSECDGREYSIAYPLPGYGVAVFPTNKKEFLKEALKL